MLSSSSAIYFSVKITYLLICHHLLAHFSDFSIKLVNTRIAKPTPRAFEPVALGEFLVFTSSWSLQMPWSRDHTLRTTILFPCTPSQKLQQLGQNNIHVHIIIMTTTATITVISCCNIITALLPLFFLLSKVFFFQFYSSIIDTHQKLKVYSIMV